MRTTILGLISIGLVIAASCTITIPPAVIDAAQAALTNKPPVVVTPPADKPAKPEPVPAVDLSGPLVDPPNPPYNQAYMDEKGSWEECGIEGGRKIICRLCVIRGESGGFWMLSSLDKNRIRKTPTGLELQDWTEDGYSYHVRGSVANEPQQREIVTMKPEVAGNTGLQKYIILEVRKAK